MEFINPQIPKHINLLPRRAELVEVVNDHGMVSFDFLARRFRAVTPSTLHNDLAILAKQGYIKKLGATRGSVYTPGEKRE